MFFSNQQAEKRQLPEQIEQLRSNVQSGVQDWFSNSPTGQKVESWQNAAQQYGQNMNDRFNQTSLGQNVNQMNNVYDQRLQQLQQDEQNINAAELTAMYDSVLKQLGL